MNWEPKDLIVALIALGVTVSLLTVVIFKSVEKEPYGETMDNVVSGLLTILAMYIGSKIDKNEI